MKDAEARWPAITEANVEALWQLGRQVYERAGRDPSTIELGAHGGPVVWVDGNRPAELVELIGGRDTVARVYYLETRKSGTPARARFQPHPRLS